MSSLTISLKVKTVGMFSRLQMCRYTNSTYLQLLSCRYCNIHYHHPTQNSNEKGHTC